ncbi:hypothetical protein GE061_004723 [Apolygus lucorum]|uniref:Peptidase aspartic putative domain-containing protein n=1 Tax=Apolygus lucorum TaxID=248454 RepID=A0A8S9X400_APOLU|nr:hypothetical protein GE061_004723 [Apolygus lucorum]
MTENSLKGIDRLASEIDNAVNIIRLVNLPEYLKNPILLDILVQKLNLTMKLQWGDYAVRFRGMAIDMQFNDWLQEKIEAIGFITNWESTEELPEQKEITNRPYAESSLNYARPSRGNCRLCRSREHSQMDECSSFKKMDMDARYKHVVTNGICFLCLKKGHRSIMCRSKTSCKICNGGHHQLLHPKAVENLATHHNNYDQHELDYDEGEISATTLNKKSKVLVRVVPVKLIGPKKTVETYAFCDNGSTVTMLENGLAEELGLGGNKKPLRVKWTDGSMREDPGSREVNVKISGSTDGAKEYDLHNARTVRNLCLPVQTVDVEGLAERWAHLKDVEATSYHDAKPRILIGEDNWPLTIPLKVVCGPWNGPVASKTRLGWVVHGNPQGTVSKTEKHHQVMHWEVKMNKATEGSRNSGLYDLKQEFTDSLGENTCELTRNKVEEKQNKQVAEQTIQGNRKTRANYELEKRKILSGKVEQSNDARNDKPSFNKCEREGEDEELQINDKRNETNKRRPVKLEREETKIEEWMTRKYRKIREVTLPILKQENKVPTENIRNHAETHRRKDDVASSERKKRRRDVSLWSKNERHRK